MPFPHKTALSMQNLINHEQIILSTYLCSYVRCHQATFYYENNGNLNTPHNIASPGAVSIYIHPLTSIGISIVKIIWFHNHLIFIRGIPMPEKMILIEMGPRGCFSWQCCLFHDNITNPTMHHFVAEMCTPVHMSVTKWYIAGYGTDALWDLCDKFIGWCNTAMAESTRLQTHQNKTHILPLQVGFSVSFLQFSLNWLTELHFMN